MTGLRRGDDARATGRDHQAERCRNALLGSAFSEATQVYKRRTAALAAVRHPVVYTALLLDRLRRPVHDAPLFPGDSDSMHRRIFPLTKVVPAVLFVIVSAPRLGAQEAPDRAIVRCRRPCEAVANAVRALGGQLTYVYR